MNWFGANELVCSEVADMQQKKKDTHRVLQEFVSLV